ncbi:hypothetical protein [Methylobacterium brachythecii]|uniref:Uncharacterized protein n=1 Tax=Methylobacterium brachythecii TaxID=1176177 RepID=A0A7W6F9A8_9HYPH|nr:hypothetical protein [Methylobacterium brachythecii]MBB3905315.1 hypothetical protein [Methylobacterium brachythecii]GLS45914.1 hypothetical protein GCM10007884_39050 [Methylobacterium brachythecii]
MPCRRPDPRQTSLADLLDLTLAPAPVLSPLEALVEAGIIRNVHLCSGGHIPDPDQPFMPRSLCFPVAYIKTWYDPEPRLYLNTPACADIPLVQRVEAVTGMRAVWDPRAANGQWHHAIDLASDADWRRLASSMAHTTVEAVEQAVGLKLTWGELSVANARALLAAIGSVEPDGRSAAEWDGISPGTSGGISCLPRGAWWAVHGLEDGWYRP